eukprot:2350018-Prymnesium_polylepis.1
MVGTTWEGPVLCVFFYARVLCRSCVFPLLRRLDEGEVKAFSPPLTVVSRNMSCKLRDDMAAWTLPLTHAQLRAIRSAAFAEDVPIDVVHMSRLTPAEATTAFEGGGLDTPSSAQPALPQAASATDPALCGLLAEHGLPPSVGAVVGARHLEDWLTFLAATSRPTVLAELKRLGVGALAARQAFTNALSKAARNAIAALDDTTAPAAPMGGLPPLNALAVEVNGGLCNRLRVCLSFLAVARTEQRQLVVVWPYDRHACPGHFADCFEPPPDCTFCEAPPAGVRAQPAPPFAAFHPQVAGTSLEVGCYAALRPNTALRRAVEQRVATAGATDGAQAAAGFSFAAAHVRRTDHWGSGTADDEFVRFLRSQPLGAGVYVATDNAQTQGIFLRDEVIGARVRATCKPIVLHADGDGSRGGGPFGMGQTVRHTT